VSAWIEEIPDCRANTHPSSDLGDGKERGREEKAEVKFFSS